jgi:hypothetical protein
MNTPKPENVAAANTRIKALNARGTLQAAHAADRALTAMATGLAGAYLFADPTR